MVLSGKGLVVTFIDKTSALTTWSLEELLNLVPRDSAEKKLVESAKRKLGYVKILLGK
jgi:ubiquinone biosynthesis protein COQ9